MPRRCTCGTCTCGSDAGLSDVELRIVVALANGLEVEEIAVQLHYTPATVNTYITRVRGKLGARHRGHLTGVAFLRRLIKVDPRRREIVLAKPLQVAS